MALYLWLFDLTTLFLPAIDAQLEAEESGEEDSDDEHGGDSSLEEEDLNNIDIDEGTSIGRHRIFTLFSLFIRNYRFFAIWKLLLHKYMVLSQFIWTKARSFARGWIRSFCTNFLN